MAVRGNLYESLPRGNKTILFVLISLPCRTEMGSNQVVSSSWLAGIYVDEVKLTYAKPLVPIRLSL